MVTNKMKVEDIEMVALTKECSSMFIRKMPKNLKDLESFSLYKLVSVM